MILPCSGTMLFSDLSSKFVNFALRDKPVTESHFALQKSLVFYTGIISHGPIVLHGDSNGLAQAVTKQYLHHDAPNLVISVYLGTHVMQALWFGRAIFLN